MIPVSLVRILLSLVLIGLLLGGCRVYEWR